MIPFIKEIIITQTPSCIDHYNNKEFNYKLLLLENCFLHIRNIFWYTIASFSPILFHHHHLPEVEEWIFRYLWNIWCACLLAWSFVTYSFTHDLSLISSIKYHDLLAWLYVCWSFNVSLLSMTNCSWKVIT